MILLDDDEIEDIISETIQAWADGDDNVQIPQAVVRAQLKKVVEYLAEHDVLCTEDESSSCVVCRDFYKTLKKEVGG